MRREEVQLITQEFGTTRWPAEDRQGGADVLLLPGLDNSPPRHWQSHSQQLSHCRRVALGDWDRPRLHEWVPALDRAVRRARGPSVLLAPAWDAWPPPGGRPCAGSMRFATRFAAPCSLHRRMPTRSTPIRAFATSARCRGCSLPLRSILVASRSDPYAPFARSELMAACWGSELVDAGEAGHLNAEFGLYEWTQGLRLLARLSGHNPNLLVAELGLRTAMA